MSCIPVFSGLIVVILFMYMNTDKILELLTKIIVKMDFINLIEQIIGEVADLSQNL